MKVGFVGWRGMVGSVLMQRMLEEKDFGTIDPYFFTTSNAGGKAPDIDGRARFTNVFLPRGARNIRAAALTAVRPG